jgi:hypothetical protein
MIVSVVLKCFALARYLARLASAHDHLQVFRDLVASVVDTSRVPREYLLAPTCNLGAKAVDLLFGVRYLLRASCMPAINKGLQVG